MNKLILQNNSDPWTKTFDLGKGQEVGGNLGSVFAPMGVIIV